MSGSKDEAAAQVLQVPEGSLIVLYNVHLGAPEATEAMTTAIMHACGHTRWALLQVDNGGPVEVWGPDVDHVERLRAMLRQVS